jgi:acyl-CoA-dependent ceramide synthase
MIRHNDYKWQPHQSQSRKDVSINGQPECKMAVCFDCPPTQYREWQQGVLADQPDPTKTLREELLEHQLGLCINIMLVILLSYLLFPDLKDMTGGFFMLSYPLENLYGIGPQDLKLVFGFITFFTAARVIMMDYVLKPLTAKLGILKPKTQTRFIEQSYMIIYYTVFWSWGLKVFINNTPTKTNGVQDLLISLWSGFLQLRLQATLKLYYLLQLAFWIQQVAVLHLESRRKDHLQMLSHHVVTIILLTGSYSYRQWRVGNAVLVCMDLVDIILPLAKVLRYASFQRSCDATFGVFVVAWILTRHALFLTICWSIYEHVHDRTMAYGAYSTVTGEMISPNGNDKIFANIFQPFLDPSTGSVTFNASIRWLFLGLLLLLQCIIITWFVMIVQVMMRIIRGEGANDVRSEDEDGE